MVVVAQGVLVLLLPMLLLVEDLELLEMEQLTKAVVAVEEQEVPLMEVLLLVHLGAREAQETPVLEMELTLQLEPRESPQCMEAVEPVEDRHPQETEEQVEMDTLD